MFRRLSPLLPLWLILGLRLLPGLPVAHAESFSTQASAAFLSPAPASGDCSLKDATPATVVTVNADAIVGVELLLDDGRRTTLAGLEFSSPGALLQQKISHWLARQLVFVGPTTPDRWGRSPALLFAAAGTGPSSPLIAVGAAAIEAGLARYRPDPVAAPCRTDFLAAESRARAQRTGLWANPDLWPVDAEAPEATAILNLRKGLTLVEGVVRSVGAGPRAFYLNFGHRRAVDFAVVISRRFSYNQPDSGFEPAQLIGRRVRVRGLIDTNRGPRIEIAGPEDIEIVESFSAP